MSVVEGPAKRRAGKMTLFDASRGDRGTAKPRRDVAAPAAPKPAPAPKQAAPKSTPAPASPKEPAPDAAAVALRSTVGNVKALAKMRPEVVAATLAEPGLAVEVVSAAGWLRSVVKRAAVLDPIPMDEGRARSDVYRVMKGVAGLVRTRSDVLVDLLGQLPPGVVEQLGADGEFLVRLSNSGDTEPDVREMLAEVAARLGAMSPKKRRRAMRSLDTEALTSLAATLTELAERRTGQAADEDEDEEAEAA